MLRKNNNYIDVVEWATKDLLESSLVFQNMLEKYFESEDQSGEDEILKIVDRRIREQATLYEIDPLTLGVIGAIGGASLGAKIIGSRIADKLPGAISKIKTAYQNWKMRRAANKILKNSKKKPVSAAVAIGALRAIKRSKGIQNKGF